MCTLLKIFLCTDLQGVIFVSIAGSREGLTEWREVCSGAGEIWHSRGAGQGGAGEDGLGY